MADDHTTTEALDDDARAMADQLDRELQPLVEGGALSEAIDRLSTTLETMGDDERPELRARLLAWRGEYHLDIGHRQKALDDAHRAIELSGRDPVAYGVAGWANYELDKTSRALEYFDEALELDPDDVTVLTGRALVLMELDEYERARADVTHALHRDSQADDLLELRGEIHMQLGDLEAAARDLESALELAPRDPEYALMLARLRLAEGDVDEALDVVDGAVDEDEAFALEAMLLRSHLHLLGGDNEAARSDAIRASNLYPDEAFAFVQLAHVQLAEGNLDLAEKAAERAVLLDPSLSDSYLVRGAARQMSGDTDEARQDFERASQAPAELPMFLLGPADHLVDRSATGFDPQLLEMLGGQTAGGGFDPGSFAEAFGGGAATGDDTQAGPDFGAGGLGGMDPMNMLDQIFDDSGNIRGPLKPIFEMAFKNAPQIMENIPDEMLGDIDKEELEEMDFSEMSGDEIEERMREFYQMMKSGPESPADGDDGNDGDSGGDRDGGDD